MVNCKYALFTGCVAKGAGRELLTATEAVCEKLSIELAEMTDASCCGAGVISEDRKDSFFRILQIGRAHV